MKHNFNGKWESNSDSNLFSETSGRIEYYIDYAKKYDILKTQLIIHDGFWIDDPSIIFNIISDQYNSTEEIIIFSTNISFSSTNSDTCIIQGQLELKQSPNNSNSHIETKGNISSLDCNFDISFNGNLNKSNLFEKPRIAYSFVLFCVCFIQTFIVTRFQEIIITYESMAKKTSLMTWFMNAGIEFSIVLFNIQELVRDQISLESMMMGLIWSLISFYTIRSKLLLFLYRSHNPDISYSTSNMLFLRILFAFCK